jgi:hypothetical protein
MSKNEIIKDIIGGGDTKRCKLKDTQEDLWVSLGACLWAFVLMVGVDHWQKELMISFFKNWFILQWNANETYPLILQTNLLIVNANYRVLGFYW